VEPGTGEFHSAPDESYFLSFNRKSYIPHLIFDIHRKNFNGDEMVSTRTRLRFAGLAPLALFVILIGIAQAAYPPQADLSISKEAQIAGSAVQEVSAGTTFDYVINVANKGPNNAPEVVITDKLPYEVEYVSAVVVYPGTTSTINKSGDLIYIRFDEIPANTTGSIIISVKAPTQTPTTLYNMVNIRYGNDPNQGDNSMVIATYVPQTGYNQTEAAKSFEDLLHNQSQMLFEFEDLLHTIPQNDSENYIFIASFEQLLRSQANLTGSFEDLLSNASNTGWDSSYTMENRTYLLKSYERMLWDEAFLFASFHAKLNDSWISLCNYTAPGHSQDAQTEFIASLEDLLKRQNKLYLSFDLLLQKIEVTNHTVLIDFLAAYENRLRVQANLYMSFRELLSWKYEGSGPCGWTPGPVTCVPPTVTVQRTSMNPGQKFNVTVTNNDVVPLTVLSLTGTFAYDNGAPLSWILLPPASGIWGIAGNMVTYSVPLGNIAANASQTYTLDRLLIQGGNTPGNLTYTFSVATGCGTVTRSQTDLIVGVLSPATEANKAAL
jgi:uncharacterized repeat protein (TIGR01451 family)